MLDNNLQVIRGKSNKTIDGLFSIPEPGIKITIAAVTDLLLLCHWHSHVVSTRFSLVWETTDFRNVYIYAYLYTSYPSNENEYCDRRSAYAEGAAHHRSEDEA